MMTQWKLDKSLLSWFLVNYDNDFCVCHSKQGNSACSKRWTPLYEELLCIELKGQLQGWCEQNCKSVPFVCSFVPFPPCSTFKITTHLNSVHYFSNAVFPLWN